MTKFVPPWVDRTVSSNGTKFIYLDPYNVAIPNVPIAMTINYHIADEFVRLWNEARGPQPEILHYDNETLNKVQRALLRKHFEFDQATLIISEIQNAGILFRERARE
jgi:hypothetical protein